MKTKSRNIILLLLLVITSLLTGCSSTPSSKSKETITLNMWHNYGGTMQKTMDSLVDQFNSTIGHDKGIVINVTAITSSSELQNNLNSIIEDEPGAPSMPDICTAYPKTAILLHEKNLISDFNNYFSTEDLSKYIDAFISEGNIDNGLYVFPIAKSTEILYLNQTLFDKFAKDTGVTIDSLSTFEGISDISKKYYIWSKGKQFFSADSWFNVAQVGLKQLDSNIFSNEIFNLSTEQYKHIFETCADASINGGFAIYDGYSSDLSKTGDLVCSTGSSAGILFYGDTITYPDNTVEKVEYSILPYPIFSSGKKLALQRGNGLVIKKSTTEREKAASVFIKWLTDSKQNMTFISSTGYLPVTKTAFEDDLPNSIKNNPNSKISAMHRAVIKMYDSYEFFTPEIFKDFDSFSKNYDVKYREFMNSKTGNLYSLNFYSEFIELINKE